jgi:hypothetical protein
MSNRSLLRLYLLKYLHAKIVKAATNKNVSPAAIKMILLLYPQIEIPTSKEKTMVKRIKIGRANFRKASVAQPIKHDKAISKTDKMMITGVLTNIFWKKGLL